MGKLSNLRQQKQQPKTTWQEKSIDHEELSVLAGHSFTLKDTTLQKQKKEKSTLSDKVMTK